MINYNYQVYNKEIIYNLKKCLNKIIYYYSKNINFY